MPKFNFAKPVAVALLALACAGAASARQGDPSAASRSSEYGSGFIVAGSAAILGGAGSLMVAAVEPMGESVVVTLRTASDAGTVSIEMSAAAARGLTLSAGTTVSAVAESTGYLLIVAGKVLAFVPNEIGRGLLHHSRTNGRWA